MATSGSHKRASLDDENTPSREGPKKMSTGIDYSSFLEAGPSKAFTSSTLEPSTSKAATPQSGGKKKLSMRKLSVEASMEDIPLNDDCSELNEEKEKTTVTEKENLNTQNDQPDAPTYDLDLSVIEKMTPKDLQEHIAYCVKLTSENKINPKNAFTLKLIDVMTLLKKEDKDNFAAMACQLDAGAKIYSSRVDAVYHDAVKLVEQCIINDKKKQSEKNDALSDDEDIEDVARKDKKKKAAKNVIATNDQISRQAMESDPKNKFIKLEAQPGSIMNRVQYNAEDLSLTLDKNTAFWVDLSTYKPVRPEGETSIPDIEIMNRSLRPKTDSVIEDSYAKLEPLLTSKAAATGGISEEVESDDDFIPPSQEDFPVFGSTQESEDRSEPEDDLVHDDETEPSIISIAKTRMASKGSSQVSTTDVVKTLFHNPGESEYHYLKLKSSEYWAGPEYWLRQRGPNYPENKRKAIKKKKEPVEVTYSETCDQRNLTDKESVVGKKAATLSKRTMAKWSKKRVTYPQDLHFEPETLTMLHSINVSAEIILDDKESIESEVKMKEDKNTTYHSTRDDCTSPDLFADNEEENEEDEPPFKGFMGSSTTNHDSLKQEVVEDFLGFEEIEVENEEKVVKEEVSEETCDLYDGDNLVPMVKTVKVDPIRIVAKPNRVDMHHLKSVMLNIIRKEIEDQENKLKDEGVLSPRGAISFKEILRNLFTSSEIQRRTLEDLTTQMAFLCLLTLVNENNFQVKKEDGEDFLIMLEY